MRRAVAGSGGCSGTAAMLLYRCPSAGRGNAPGPAGGPGAAARPGLAWAELSWSGRSVRRVGPAAGAAPMRSKGRGWVAPVSGRTRGRSGAGGQGPRGSPCPGPRCALRREDSAVRERQPQLCYIGVGYSPAAGCVKRWARFLSDTRCHLL